MKTKNASYISTSGRPADEYGDADEVPEVIARSAPLMILGNRIWVKKVQVLQKLESLDLDCVTFTKKWTAIFEVHNGSRLKLAGFSNGCVWSRSCPAVSFWPSLANQWAVLTRRALG